jgi:hypothetical protein
MKHFTEISIVAKQTIQLRLIIWHDATKRFSTDYQE